MPKKRFSRRCYRITIIPLFSNCSVLFESSVRMTPNVRRENMMPPRGAALGCAGL
jgi:hypothetical protein